MCSEKNITFCFETEFGTCIKAVTYAEEKDRVQISINDTTILNDKILNSR